MVPRDIGYYVDHHGVLYWLKPFLHFPNVGSVSEADFIKSTSPKQIGKMLERVQKRAVDSLSHIFVAKKENTELLHLYPMIRVLTDDSRNYDGLQVSHAALVLCILPELLWQRDEHNNRKPLHQQVLLTQCMGSDPSARTIVFMETAGTDQQVTWSMGSGQLANLFWTHVVEECDCWATKIDWSYLLHLYCSYLISAHGLKPARVRGILMECKYQVPRDVNGGETGAEFLLRFKDLANRVYGALIGLNQVQLGIGSEASSIAMTYYPSLTELKMLLGQQMTIIATPEQYKVLLPALEGCTTLDEVVDIMLVSVDRWADQQDMFQTHVNSVALNCAAMVTYGLPA